MGLFNNLFKKKHRDTKPISKRINKSDNNIIIKRVPYDKLSLNIDKDLMSKDGYYCFDNLTIEESNQLKLLIQTAIKNGELASLSLIENSLIAYLYRNKYLIEQIIIEKYSNSDSLYDNLAVGLAYKEKGAAYREQAIHYIEAFINKANDTDWNNIKKVNNEEFKKAKILYILSELFEKEHFWDKAYEYAVKAKKASRSKNINYDRVGDVLVKIDINKAVEYYEKEANKESPFKEMYQNKLEKAIEKQKKNYKYKPRKVKTDYNKNFEDGLKNASLKFLEYFN